ncbi:MAG: FecR protein [Myxococcaceae bacterium]|nr:FecR protein [Myxococcaceae bacterium]
MSTLCRDVELWIGRPLSSLSEAERLVLEQHLFGCEACRRTSALARTITALVSSAPTGLGASARERAIAGAFGRVQQTSASVRPTARGLQLGAALLAAAAVLIGLRLAWVERAPIESASLASRSDKKTSAPMATEGAGAATREQTHEQTREQESLWIAAAATEARTFGHARVVLAAGTRVRFDARASALELASGQVTVDVDPGRRLPFAVVTQQFRVQVLGTQFVVTPERVDVQRGHVQVLSVDGQTRLRDLKSGQSFEYARELRSRQTQASSQERVVPARARSRAHVDEDASVLLGQARTALAKADVQAARALIARARTHAARGQQRAEAGTLLAECALLERHNGEAIRSYLAVAERYPGLDAGENALFAAAQLSAREANRDAGRALFARYLARYPGGRFAEEARARLH